MKKIGLGVMAASLTVLALSGTALASTTSSQNQTATLAVPSPQQAISQLVTTVFNDYLSYADNNSFNGKSSIADRDAGFKNQYATMLSPTLLSFYKGYIERVRNSASLIGRTYINHDTTWKLNSISVNGNTATVDVIEKTKMYYTTPTDNSGTQWEGYVYDHTLTLLNNNGRWVVESDVVPDVYDSNTTVWDHSTASQLQLNTASNSSTTNTMQKKTASTRMNSGDITPNTVQSYNGSNAAAYADTWWDSYNSAYTVFSGDDCTNFLSQCLEAGLSTQVPSAYNTPAVVDASGSYQWDYINYYSNTSGGHANSASWSAAENSRTYWYDGQINTAMGHIYDPPAPSGTLNFGGVTTSVGDAVYYDWTSDGAIDHAAIITGYSSGRPYIDQHSNFRYHQDITGYPNNPQITTTTVYVVHIPNWSPTD